MFWSLSIDNCEITYWGGQALLVVTQNVLRDNNIPAGKQYKRAIHILLYGGLVTFLVN